MNRRGFIGGILAACAAPAIVRADSLMRLAAPNGWGLGPSGILMGEIETGRYENIVFILRGPSMAQVVIARVIDAEGNYAMFVPGADYERGPV
jgi:hypothetical protein